jgi:hypothetical protein
MTAAAEGPGRGTAKIQPARKYARTAMVAIASPRTIVCPMRIISRPTDDHTHASRRAPEPSRKMCGFCKNRIAERVGP